MPNIRESISNVANPGETHRGSNHDFYHGRDPSPTKSNTYGKRQGRSPIRVRARSPIRDCSRAPERSRSPRSPSRRDYERRDEPSRAYPKSASTYRPNYDSYPRPSDRDLGKDNPRRASTIASTNRPAVVNDTKLVEDASSVKPNQPRPVESIQISPTSPPVSEPMSETEPVAVEQPKEDMVTPAANDLPALKSVFARLLDSSIDTATFKQQTKSTKKDHELRTSEFNKCVSMHEKYPNTKARQIEERERAAKRHRVSEENLQKSQESLNTIASDLMGVLVPHIITCISAEIRNNQSKDQKTIVEELQARCEAADKARSTLQATVENLQQSLEDYKRECDEKTSSMKATLLEEIQKKNAIKADLDDLKREYSTRLNQTTSDVTSLKDGYATIKAATEDEVKILRQDMDSGAMQSHQSLADLKSSLTSLESHPRLQGSDPLVVSLATRLAAFESTVNLTTTKLKNIEDGVSNNETSYRRLAKLDEVQKGYLIRLNQHQQRLDSHDSADYVTTDKVEAVMNNNLNGIKGRISSLETAKEAATHTVNTLKEQIKLCEDRPMPSDSAEVLQALENRLSKVEKQASAPVQPPKPLVESAQAASWSSDQTSRIIKIESNVTNMENQLTLLAGHSGSILDSVRDIVFEAVEAAVKEEIVEIDNSMGECREAVQAFEGSIKTIQEENSREFETLQGRIVQVEQSLPSTATITNEIIDNLRNDPNTLPHLAHLDRTVQTFQQELQAIHNGLANHEARINNVNTGHLANHIVEQLPYGHMLNDIEASKRRQQALETDVRALQSTRTENDDDIRTISAKASETRQAITTLEAKFTGNFGTIADRFGEVIEHSEKLRSDIDKINETNHVQRIENLESHLEPWEQMLADVQSKHGSFAGMSEKVSTTGEGFVSLQKDISKAQEILDKVPDLQSSITELRELVNTGNWSENISTLDSRIENIQAQVDGVIVDIEDLPAITQDQNRLKEALSEIPKIWEHVRSSTKRTESAKSSVLNSVMSRIPNGSTGGPVQKPAEGGRALSHLRESPKPPASGGPTRKSNGVKNKAPPNKGKNGASSPARKKRKRTGLVEDSEHDDDELGTDDDNSVTANRQRKPKKATQMPVPDEDEDDDEVTIVDWKTKDHSADSESATPVRKFERPI